MVVYVYCCPQSNHTHTKTLIHKLNLNETERKLMIFFQMRGMEKRTDLRLCPKRKQQKLSKNEHPLIILEQ